ATQFTKFARYPRDSLQRPGQSTADKSCSTGITGLSHSGEVPHQNHADCVQVVNDAAARFSRFLSELLQLDWSSQITGFQLGRDMIAPVAMNGIPAKAEFRRKRVQ